MTKKQKPQQHFLFFVFVALFWQLLINAAILEHQLEVAVAHLVQSRLVIVALVSPGSQVIQIRCLIGITWLKP